MLIGAGFGWQRLRPGGLEAAEVRRNVNALLIYLLVPALIFRVMVHAPMDHKLLLAVTSGWISIAFSGVLAYGLHCLLASATTLPASTRGALVLAAVFGNGLGAALPVLHSLYDGRQDSLALGYELLSTIPLSWTAGVYVAMRFGSGTTINPLRQILSLPPVWAIVLALGCNLCAVPVPAFIDRALEPLGNGVMALMLLTLGMALDFRPNRAWRWIALPVAIRVGGGLAVGLVLGSLFGMPAEDRAALIWICAAPSFMMGLVYCDRFGLDTPVFALAMSASVLVYLVGVPLLLGALVA